MGELEKIFDKMIDLLKGLKPGTVAGGRNMPSIKQPSIGKVSAPTKISGANPPASKKNPLKQAAQIQNKDFKDQKMKEARSALNINKGEDDFPFKNAHTHEEKMKQLNEAYDKHKALHDRATDKGSKNYHMGHLNRLKQQIETHTRFKKSESISFNKGGQWSLKE